MFSVLAEALTGPGMCHTRGHLFFAEPVYAIRPPALVGGGGGGQTGLLHMLDMSTHVPLSPPPRKPAGFFQGFQKLQGCTDLEGSIECFRIRQVAQISCVITTSRGGKCKLYRTTVKWKL